MSPGYTSHGGSVLFNIFRVISYLKKIKQTGCMMWGIAGNIKTGI